MLTDFHKLADLLRSQKEALQKDDSNRLAALLPLIEEYSRRTARHQAALREGSPQPDGLAEAKSEILRLAAENQQSYRRRQEHLHEIQTQLQSAGRYLRHVRRQNRTARPPVSWTV